MAVNPQIVGSINGLISPIFLGSLAGDSSDGGGGGGGGAATTGNFVVSGGSVVWQSGLEFLVSATVYVIQGTQYTSEQQSITLDAADGSNPRIDVIGLDTDGLVFKVTGTAAANPSEPSVDPITQLRLAFVNVGTGATTPTGVSNTSLYAEDAGSPTEWDWAEADADWAEDSVTDPRTGTKCIRGTALDANDAITGTIGTGSIDPNNFNQLVFYLKPTTVAWASGRSLRVEFLNSSSVRQGVAVSVIDGLWGFSRSNITTYQVIAIPTIYFQIPVGTAITKLRFTAVGTGGTMNCGIDDVLLQVSPIGTPTVTGITQEQADARYVLKAEVSNSIDVTGGTGRSKVQITSTTMAGTATLTASSDFYQVFDPDGSNRNVDLPAEAAGLAFFIVNRGNNAETITVRNDAAGTVDTIENDEALSVICDGTRWISAKATLVIV